MAQAAAHARDRGGAQRAFLAAPGSAGLRERRGVERDAVKAAALYCKAAWLGDAEAQFNLGWMYANGRGVERSDTAASSSTPPPSRAWSGRCACWPPSAARPTTPECMIDRAAADARRRWVAAAPPIEVIPPDAPRHIVDIVKRHAAQYRPRRRWCSPSSRSSRTTTPSRSRPRNAKGLMQLIPETAARLAWRAPTTPSRTSAAAWPT